VVPGGSSTPVAIVTVKKRMPAAAMSARPTNPSSAAGGKYSTHSVGGVAGRGVETVFRFSVNVFHANGYQ
jgi:hypothetical protein